MYDFDGRKLDHRTFEEIRIRAVKPVGQLNHGGGVKLAPDIESLGFSHPRLDGCLTAYREERNVRLSEVPVGRLLNPLGLNPQGPLRRDCRQDPETVERWKQKVYPKNVRKHLVAGPSHLRALTLSTLRQLQ